MSHAVYTMSASTASSQAPALRRTRGQAAATRPRRASTAGPSAGHASQTIGVNYSLTPGDYLFAWWASAANNATINMFGRAGVNIVRSVRWRRDRAYFMNGIRTLV